MRITLLGFLLPEPDFQDLLETDPGMPVQTQRFGAALALALRRAGAEISLISTYPTVSYPHNRRIRFASKRIVQEGDGDSGLILGFCNLPVIKHLTRVWGVFRNGPSELRRTSAEMMLVHGVHSPWLLFGAFAAWHLNIPSVAVLTDPPNVPHPWDSRLTRTLKKIDQVIVKLLLNRFAGVVALTPALAEDFAPRVPFLVMEGIAPQPTCEASPGTWGRSEGLAVVVYAGGLTEEYGVRLLLDAHHQQQGTYRMILAGRGDMSEEVAVLAAERENLEYLGMVDPLRMSELYRQADVLVNPRPPGQHFTRYSFPSKLLEYMASGAAVISTRLEGIPEDYWDYITACEPTVAGVNEAILGLIASRKEGLSCSEVPAQEFVRTRKTAKAQGRRLLSFLKTVADG